MMACVADRIVAAPIAALGSIGVVTQIPNAFERLKSEGIAVNTLTAGKVRGHALFRLIGANFHREQAVGKEKYCPLWLLS